MSERSVLNPLTVDRYSRNTVSGRKKSANAPCCPRRFFRRFVASSREPSFTYQRNKTRPVSIASCGVVAETEERVFVKVDVHYVHSRRSGKFPAVAGYARACVYRRVNGASERKRERVREGERERERTGEDRRDPGDVTGTEREPRQIYVLFITSDTPTWRAPALPGPASSPARSLTPLSTPIVAFAPRLRPPPSRAPICLPCSEPVFARRAQHTAGCTPPAAVPAAYIRMCGDTLMTGGRTRAAVEPRGEHKRTSN